MKERKKERNYSGIELLRIILLFFLLMTHWYATSGTDDAFKFVDTTIFRSISQISVTTFALITGMFVFRKRSLVFRNVSRLLFIVLISIMIMIPILFSTNFSLTSNLKNVFTGSRDIWYIYAIIPIYIIGPIFADKIQKVPSFKLFLIATVLFAIGATGSFTGSVNGVSIFYINDFGLLFSIPFLLGLGLFGFLLKRLIDNESFKRTWLVILLLFVLTSIYLYWTYENHKLINHGNPLVLFISASLVFICCKLNWHSSKVNWIAKRLYFVYEFHWYWQFLYVMLFGKFIKDYPHLQLYINAICIFLFSSVVSIIITEIQIMVWNRYVDPVMLKGIDWTKSKLIKPKVSN